MPSDKPRFTFHIDEECLEKMHCIAEIESRSLSNLVEYVCKLYVKKYEQENGSLNIKRTNDF